MGRKKLHPLQVVIAPRIQNFATVYSKWLHERMFEPLMIEDFVDSPMPLEHLNYETQMAVLMFEGHQQYSEIMKMPIQLRHELVKAAFRMNKQQNSET